MKLLLATRSTGRIEKKHPAPYIFLSFFLPLFIITAALVGLQIVPFGDNTLVISDADLLYVNYLGFVGRAVRGLEGLTYSFEKGLGGNMMSSWGWFLLNPTFAIFALFKTSHYALAFTIVSTLNLCICGLTMYILLASLYGHQQSNLIFSTAYALCGFNVANVFQANFFIGITVLPLVVLGLLRIFHDRSPLLYILSLCYALLMNFYFGFMLCVASVLFFCAAWIADGKSVGNKRRVIVKYCLSSLLAGLLAAVIWLPALLSLRGGRLDLTTFGNYSFKEKMPFLDIFAKLFIGANSAMELIDGLPNIFVGILPVALVILFFLNKDVHGRKKAAAGFLLGVYLVCFYIIAMDMLMHGGTFTIWFNFRYSFVFSFLLLFIAAYEWQRLNAVSMHDVKWMAVILLLGTVAVFSKQYEFVGGGNVLLDLIIFALIILALWMHRKDPAKNQYRTFVLITLVLVSLELFLNYEISTRKIQSFGITKSEYRETVDFVDALVRGIQKNDNGFYRMEVNKQRSGKSGNDPMLYGYYGVGHGGSDDRMFVIDGMNKLGVHRYDLRYYYKEGVTAATDTFLGLRYVIAQEDLAEEKNYERYISFGDWVLYKNPWALPIAVLSCPELGEVEIDYSDVFENLNAIWSAMTGSAEPVFMEENEITFTAHHRMGAGEISGQEAAAIVEERDRALALKMEYENGKVSDLVSEDESDALLTDASYIEFTWLAKKDGAVYIYNRSGVTEREGSAEPVLACLGYYHAGETVTGYLLVPGDMVSTYLLEDVAGRFRAAYANADALAVLSRIVRSRPITIEKIKESYLRGEFISDGNQLLLFTIPWDEGWTLWVDGETVEIRKVLNLFMAAEAPKGTHSYELRFVPAGLKGGTLAATVGLLALLIYLPIDLTRRKRRNDAQPETMDPTATKGEAELG